MAKKRTGRLAGLAALAGAAYMINEKLGKDKDAKFQKDRIDQTSKRIPNDVASSENTTAKKDVVSSVNTTDPKPVEKYSSAYNPVASRDTLGQAARNLGVGDATNGAESPKSAPVVKPEVKAKTLPKAGIVTKEQLAEFRRRFGKDKTLTDYMNARNALINQDAGKQLKPIVLPDRYRMGGKVKEMASGGITASRRGDGIAQRGRTRGKIR